MRTTITTTHTTMTTAMSTETRPAIPVELSAPDISAHRHSATGTEYVHTFDSGKPGPHVMVSALTHGNEICGAIVVDRMLRSAVRPIRGRLTLAFANVAAFLRFDPAQPMPTQLRDEDSKMWTPGTLDGPAEGGSSTARCAPRHRAATPARQPSMLEPSHGVIAPVDKGSASP